MPIKDSSGQIQIGAHATPANNLVIDNSSNLGTTSIYTGNAGTPVTIVQTIDTNGKVWGGRVLGYVQSTSNFTTTSVTTFVPVTGLTVTVNVLTGQQIKITGFCATLTANGGGQVSIFEGGSQLTQFNGTTGASINAQIILSPTAGNHTYFLQVFQNSAGTLTFGAGATYPAYLLVETL